MLNKQEVESIISSVLQTLDLQFLLNFHHRIPGVRPLGMLAKAHEGRGGIHIAFHVDIFHIFFLKNGNWLWFTGFWYSLEGLIKDLTLWCGVSCVDRGSSGQQGPGMTKPLCRAGADLEWQGCEISHDRHLISTTDLHASWVLRWECSVFPSLPIEYSGILPFSSLDPWLPFCCRILLIFLQDLSFSW